MNPLAIKDADCYGNLGTIDQTTKNCNQRYFVLKDACLYIFLDINSTTALGILNRNLVT